MQRPTLSVVPASLSESRRHSDPQTPPRTPPSVADRLSPASSRDLLSAPDLHLEAAYAYKTLGHYPRGSREEAFRRKRSSSPQLSSRRGSPVDRCCYPSEDLSRSCCPLCLPGPSLAVQAAAAYNARLFPASLAMLSQAQPPRLGGLARLPWASSTPHSLSSQRSEAPPPGLPALASTPPYSPLIQRDGGLPPPHRTPPSPMSSGDRLEAALSRSRYSRMGKTA